MQIDKRVQSVHEAIRIYTHERTTCTDGALFFALSPLYRRAIICAAPCPGGGHPGARGPPRGVRLTPPSRAASPSGRTRQAKPHRGPASRRASPNGGCTEENRHAS